jgi:hypothetical protein
MAFVQGDIVALSISRWMVLIVGADNAIVAAGNFRGVVLSPNPAEVRIANGDENVTAFRTNVVVPTPAGKPKPGDIVRIVPSPLAFQNGGPITLFPKTVEMPSTFQVWYYAFIAGFANYCVMVDEFGAAALALPDELVAIR